MQVLPLCWLPLPQVMSSCVIDGESLRKQARKKEKQERKKEKRKSKFKNFERIA